MQVTKATKTVVSLTLTMPLEQGYPTTPGLYCAWGCGGSGPVTIDVQPGMRWRRMFTAEFEGENKLRIPVSRSQAYYPIKGNDSILKDWSEAWYWVKLSDIPQKDLS